MPLSVKASFTILVIGMFLLCPFGGTPFLQAAEKSGEFDAHASSYRYFFQDEDMDFHFGNLVLGASVNQGCSVGEAFYAASKIKDGDAKTWHKAWFDLAELVQARGERALAKGHDISARSQFLRAAYYYRISSLAMNPMDSRFLERGQKCRRLMKKLGPLFDPPLEYIEIPFEDTVIPGYFRAANHDGSSAKTLIMIGGGETYIEDLYFYLARQAYERGCNFLTVDLPGQGLMPVEGKVFRTDTYVPMKSVVDYALSRPETDPDGIAAYGISGGGLFVPQAAMHDKRIKAIAMNSAVTDAYTLFKTMPAVTADEKEMNSWTSFHRGIVEAICLRYGVEKPADLAKANQGNTFDPEKIDAPALIIVGQGEYQSKAVQEQQKYALDNFPNPKKKMVVTPTAEGATNHCVMENRDLVGQVLFDWLDEVLE